MSIREGVELLSPEEAATLLGVHPGTVARWGREGRLLSVRTAGGHRRYFAAEVAARLRGESPERARELALAEKALLTGGGRRP